MAIPNRHRPPRPDHRPHDQARPRGDAAGRRDRQHHRAGPPRTLDEVAAAIAALAGCEVHGRDPRGKLIIVVDAPDTGSLGTMLTTISLLPHVHTASLVFHATEAS